ncbi:hypothetical protein [Ferruginibacter sp. SUN106]|uniref:hypothetical protein n=1 Tax=Ferruginibacter sp. SUN106 TaxID=2978348 RepID=UPI003D36EB15
MKKQTFAIAVAFLFSIQTKAQNTIPPNNIPQANIPPKTVVVQQPNASVHLLNISGITLSIDSSVHVTSGAGATKHYFKATINYTGPGTIQYQWVLINMGAPTQPPVVQGTLQLSGTGTDFLFTERDHVNNNAQKKLTFKIISPVQTESNTITF